VLDGAPVGGIVCRRDLSGPEVTDASLERPRHPHDPRPSRRRPTPRQRVGRRAPAWAV